MAEKQSLKPDCIINAPKEEAAPAEASTMRAPTQICRTPRAKTRALFHHGTLIFLTSATGRYGMSVEILSIASLFSSLFSDVSII